MWRDSRRRPDDDRPAWAAYVRDYNRLHGIKPPPRLPLWRTLGRAVRARLRAWWLRALGR